MDAKLLNPEQEIDTQALHKLQSLEEFNFDKSQGSKKEYIETIFNERFTLFNESKHSFENITKEVKI